MKRLDAYSQPTAPWTRIEMLVAAFDGIIERLEQAHQLMVNGDALKAQPLLLRSQRIVLALYEGIDLRYGKIPENMQKLYLFVLNSIGVGTTLDLPAALNVLRTIRGGLESIRHTASEMERRGDVSPTFEDARVLKHIVA